MVDYNSPTTSEGPHHGRAAGGSASHSPEGERAPEIKPNKVYTTRETRDFLKISSSTLKRLLKKGIIKAHKVGGQYRIWGREILRLLSPRVEEKAVDIYRHLKEKTKKTIEKW